MATFYRDEQLHIGTASKSIALERLCQNYKHPVYVYDLEDILHRVELFKSAFDQNVEIHYALKANANPIILKALRLCGLGVDVVSAGELRYALEAGFQPREIIFAGVGKSRAEIELAIDLQIKQLNVESPQELRRIGEIARAKKAKIAIGLRINPDVDPDTHPYITTGFRENKFGMDDSFMPELEKIFAEYSSELNLQGLTIHIGSQILAINSFLEAIEKTLPLYKEFQKQGHPIQTFDIGGGLGIGYQRELGQEELERIQEYGAAIAKILQPHACRILAEPGRTFVGAAGLLLTQVQYIKKTPFKNFAIVDTGMQHLMRPSLYQAEHRIFPLRTYANREEAVFDIVGPICESADVLGYGRKMQEPHQDDFLAIADTGAYGYSMASNYNMHDLPEEIVVYQGEIIDSQNLPTACQVKRPSASLG